MSVTTVDAARAWYAVGASPIPATTDGDKRPFGLWKQYQTDRADERQLADWFGDGHPGIGVVTGAVSHNLEMFEFEGRAVQDGVFARFMVLLATEDSALLTTLMAGYIEDSPSGGLHLFYRVSGPVAGNTKLAQRPDPSSPGRVQPLIETRGEGGFVIVAPSHGGVHPSGRPWTVRRGSVDTIPTLTPVQRDLMHVLAHELDEMPPPPVIPDPDREAFRDGAMWDGDRTPGEDFTARATWSEVLTPHGWTVVWQRGSRIYWRRPGKSHGVSAVSGGDAGDFLWVWSTSTELPAEEGMSKWRAFALLEHRGDFSHAASALRKEGYGSPRRAPTMPVTPDLTLVVPVAAGAGEASSDTTVGPVPNTTHRLTDDANALLLAERHGDQIRYCAQRGLWMHWTGQLWSWCADRAGGRVREYAKLVGRSLPDGDAEARRHKTRTLSARGITDLLAQARSLPTVAVSLADLDAHPYELNTPDGIVDLRTGRTASPDPAHLHTRMTTVAPDYHADRTQWTEFLTETFGGHPEMPDYLQRLIGYSASGVVTDHVMPFCFGSGGNGKSVFLETISDVLGQYATAAPNSFLMRQPYREHSTEIARLAGMRFVICSEVNETDRFDEARVKQLTGGDKITARFMGQDYFSFAPTHQLWLVGNHQPAVDSGGDSFWRRLRLIPFLNTVPRDQVIPGLQQQLVREHGPAILAWVIEGARLYWQNGLRDPESVTLATEDYAHEQDSLGQFIEDCCHVTQIDEVKTKTSVIRSAYERHCLGEGFKPMNTTAFGKALRARYGVTLYRSNGVKFYTRIALVAGDRTGHLGAEETRHSDPDLFGRRDD